jgi:murein L,D-transpeptidase YafK
MAIAAIAVAIALAGCNADDITPTGRAMAPLSPRMLATIESKNMDKNSPILVRVFKQEAELEVWKKNREGKYALLKTYPICRWSGDLGPKKKEGDRQAPEGFYTITPGQMNPNSNYYLAFNTGYPNAFDRAWGRTGSELMVHGDCSSRGCYAMTDEQIVEIYALARDAFFGGQKEFQFEAFPFRMTALNMAKHRNNPNFKFWKMLKQGYDDFEATREEPKVAVCEKRYVFDAAPLPGHGPLYFNARGKCPPHQLDPAVASVITQYRRQQEIKMANYIGRGVATAAPHQGDGGMNPVFVAELTGSSGSNDGHYTTASLTVPQGRLSHVPGALPRVPNPPGTTIPKVGAALTKPASKTTAQPAPASQPAPERKPVRLARVPLPERAPLPKEGKPAPEKKTLIANLFGKLFSAKKEAAPVPAKAPTQVAEAKSNTPVKLRGSHTEMAARPKPQPTARTRTASAPIALHPTAHRAAHKKPTAVAKHEPAKPAHKAVAQAEPAAKPTAKPAGQDSVWAAIDRHRKKPQPKPEPQIRTAYSSPQSNDSLLSGAQPVMQAGSFSSH